ncbi:hypothetical protein H4C80_15630 [Pseudomonas juntendi]|uniref:Uncharacterized protein n=1 Tax=Pseudomonas juntendi TaxID=2666183 RepID=A0A7W2KHE7_9PSED|nr:hypothetical protein [Pseudomonas juntendi]MBA6098550.1 hypothetical protein [Pseudomonas juntendi]
MVAAKKNSKAASLKHPKIGTLIKMFFIRYVNPLYVPYKEYPEWGYRIQIYFFDPKKLLTIYQSEVSDRLVFAALESGARRPLAEGVRMAARRAETAAQWRLGSQQPSPQGHARKCAWK